MLIDNLSGDVLIQFLDVQKYILQKIMKRRGVNMALLIIEDKHLIHFVMMSPR